MFEDLGRREEMARPSELRGSNNALVERAAEKKEETPAKATFFGKKNKVKEAKAKDGETKGTKILVRDSTEIVEPEENDISTNVPPGIPSEISKEMAAEKDEKNVDGERNVT